MIFETVTTTEPAISNVGTPKKSMLPMSVALRPQRSPHQPPIAAPAVIPRRAAAINGPSAALVVCQSDTIAVSGETDQLNVEPIEDDGECS
jgi:hypothetical protein